MPKKPSKPTRKPLVISIHGEGVDIEAKIRDSKELDALLTGLTKQAQVSTTPPTQAQDPESVAHDFDVVMRVIKHGESPILESIITLAQAEIDVRKSTSAATNNVS